MPFIRFSFLCLCLQIAQQPLKRLLVVVVLFPSGEVVDVLTKQAIEEQGHLLDRRYNVFTRPQVFRRATHLSNDAVQLAQSNRQVEQP
jgi:hypothetical protein